MSAGLCSECGNPFEIGDLFLENDLVEIWFECENKKCMFTTFITIRKKELEWLLRRLRERKIIEVAQEVQSSSSKIVDS